MNHDLARLASSYPRLPGLRHLNNCLDLQKECSKVIVRANDTVHVSEQTDENASARTLASATTATTTTTTATTASSTPPSLPPSTSPSPAQLHLVKVAGDKVRALKAAKADKEEVAEAVQKLLNLKHVAGIMIQSAQPQTKTQTKKEKRRQAKAAQAQGSNDSAQTLKGLSAACQLWLGKPLNKDMQVHTAIVVGDICTHTHVHLRLVSVHAPSLPSLPLSLPT
jgi:hypothetical protein